jgi:sugar phosphate isomerase/epimerase
MDSRADIARLSLNQITTQQWDVRETVDGCLRQDIPAIGLWREKVAMAGLAETARLVRDAGLEVSSLCRGGFFPAATGEERQARLEDNRHAIDEAAELGARVLALVCGPAPDRDLDAARAMVQDAIGQLIPYAAERGVTLGIEPLHPVFTGDRSVIVTLAQAIELAAYFASRQVGIIVDMYHVWWDPVLYPQIARAAGHIVGFQISDWRIPNADPLMSRGMMGDGIIEIHRIRTAVDHAGYTGPIEVEIFNRRIWEMQGIDVLRLVKSRYLMHV